MENLFYPIEQGFLYAFSLLAFGSSIVFIIPAYTFVDFSYIPCCVCVCVSDDWRSHEFEKE